MNDIFLNSIISERTNTAILKVGIFDRAPLRAKNLASVLSPRLFEPFFIRNTGELHKYAAELDTVFVYDKNEELHHLLHARSEAQWLLPVFAFAEDPEWFQMVAAIRRGVTDYYNMRTGEHLNDRTVLACTRGKKELEHRYHLQAVRLAFLSLTKRQRTVVSMLAQGITHKETAQALEISKRTIDTYSATLLEKLGVKNRYELMNLRYLMG